MTFFGRIDETDIELSTAPGAFSKDGKLFAVIQRKRVLIYSTEDYNHLTQIDVRDGWRIIGEMGMTANVSSVDFSPNKKLLLISTAGNSIIYDLDTYDYVHSAVSFNRTCLPMWFGDNNYIDCNDIKIRVYNKYGTNVKEYTPNAYGGVISKQAVDVSNEEIATYTQHFDGSYISVNKAKRDVHGAVTKIHSMDNIFDYNMTVYLRQLAIHGNLIAYAVNGSNDLRIHNIITGHISFVKTEISSSCDSLFFTPTGKYLLMTRDRTMIAVSCETNTVLHAINTIGEHTCVPVFVPNANYFLCMPTYDDGKTMFPTVRYEVIV